MATNNSHNKHHNKQLITKHGYTATLRPLHPSGLCMLQLCTGLHSLDRSNSTKCCTDGDLSTLAAVQHSASVGADSGVWQKHA